MADQCDLTLWCYPSARIQPQYHSNPATISKPWNLWTGHSTNFAICCSRATLNLRSFCRQAGRGNVASFRIRPSSSEKFRFENGTKQLPLFARAQRPPGSNRGDPLSKRTVGGLGGRSRHRALPGVGARGVELNDHFKTAGGGIRNGSLSGVGFELDLGQGYHQRRRRRPRNCQM